MFRFVLLCDGVSDKRLLPILEWVLCEGGMNETFEGVWADPAGFSRKTKTLTAKVRDTLRLYPCDLLLIHRDAEGQGAGKRYEEIANAMRDAVVTQQYVGVMPVKMNEAWLLLDETAIRKAAENPNGTMPLTLPRKKQWQELSDPKEDLNTALRTASNLRGRRLRNFSHTASAWLVVNYVDDWSPLRGLASFDALETDVREFLARRKQVVKQ